jgi:hypothetical protein
VPRKQKHKVTDKTKSAQKMNAEDRHNIVAWGDPRCQWATICTKKTTKSAKKINAENRHNIVAWSDPRCQWTTNCTQKQGKRKKIYIGQQPLK